MKLYLVILFLSGFNEPMVDGEMMPREQPDMATCEKRAAFAIDYIKSLETISGGQKTVKLPLGGVFCVRAETPLTAIVAAAGNMR